MQDYNNSPELYHWGVKGQKWGIRRYQNKDGSLTEAGRKRLRKLETEYNKITSKKLSDETKRKKPLSEMTDEELAVAAKRARTEREYMMDKKMIAESEQKLKEIYPDKKTTGKKVLDAIKGVGKDVVLPAAKESAKNAVKKYLDALFDGGLKEVKKATAETEKTIRDTVKDAAKDAKAKTKTSNDDTIRTRKFTMKKKQSDSFESAFDKTSDKKVSTDITPYDPFEAFINDGGARWLYEDYDWYRRGDY